MPSDVADIHRHMFPDDPPAASILRADAVDTGCFQDAILGVRDHMFGAREPKTLSPKPYASSPEP